MRYSVKRGAPLRNALFCRARCIDRCRRGFDAHLSADKIQRGETNMDTKYLKKVAVYIITAAASLLFIAYIIYHLWSEYNTEVTTVPAEYVKMEQ